MVGNRLTPEQVQFFRHQGYVKLPERLPEAMVEELKALITRHIAEKVAPTVADKQGRIVRLSNLWDRDPLFRAALTAPQVLDPLESLLGPNIELVKNRHNHATLRLAGDGSAYFHRDVLQWSRPLLTVLFYLQETHLENGCTWIVPGSHFLPGYANLSVWEEEALQRTGLMEQALPVPMPAGGLLAMDSLVVHSAGENRTEGTRMSLTVGYLSADELASVEDPKRVLLRGQRSYKGNY
jgi:ectoine hydroxylase-related dioxygenase (phytanoyl-CoA dioxygenase family)